MLVSGNYFDVLGIGMAAGSPIQAEDDWVPVSGGARGLVTVLSHQYWQRRFNGSAATVGTSMQINGHPLSNPRNNWLRIIASETGDQPRAGPGRDDSRLQVGVRICP
jgi:hypothetical protein